MRYLAALEVSFKQTLSLHLCYALRFLDFLFICLFCLFLSIKCKKIKLKKEKRKTMYLVRNCEFSILNGYLSFLNRVKGQLFYYSHYFT